MALSNTATPKYYSKFRDAVIRGEIPVCETVGLEMERIDKLIEHPGVYYDEASGNRWYACIDKSTGQPMQGVEVPSNEDIYSLDINVRGIFAKDSHRNVIYPLIVVNGSNGMDAAMNQY